MTSLKSRCLKNLSTDFSEILMLDAKLVLEKALKVSCRNLLPFLSYRENPAEGQNLLSPRSVARVKLLPIFINPAYLGKPKTYCIADWVSRSNCKMCDPAFPWMMWLHSYSHSHDIFSFISFLSILFIHSFTFVLIDL